MAHSQNCPNFNLPVSPSDDCFSAPPFCENYLNGYCSNNSGATADDPNGLSSILGCPIENNQWLTFVPCETSVTFTFNVGSCALGNGLEFSLLQTGDCASFSVLTACQTAVPGGMITVTAGPMNVGSTYFLMVDGVNGDACGWQIVGLNGVSDGGALQENNTPGGIAGDSLICLSNINMPSQPTPYSATGPVCTIDPVNPTDNTCPPGSNVTCPPAFQKFREPFLDTVYNVVAWDTVWRIIPAWGGHFQNNDNIGSIVYVIWDTIGYFQVDADLMPNAYDTIIFINDGIGSCGTICPDTDPCDILPTGVHVGASQKEFYNISLCFPYCTDIYNQQVCGPGYHFLIGDYIPDPPTSCVDTIELYINPLPEVHVQIVEQSPVCAGDPAILTAVATGGAPINYQWTNGANTPSIAVYPSATTNYWVNAYNQFGCDNFDNELVNTWPAPIQVALPPLQVCPSQLPFDFFGQPITTSGNYQTVMESWQGCDSTITQQITVYPPVSASISSSIGMILPTGGTTTLTVDSSSGTYVWSDQSSAQTLTVDQPGTYSVTVTAPTGCTAIASIAITQASSVCPNFNLPIAPADSCASAPSFCGTYLAGFCSANDGYTPDTPGNLASVIPCTIENNQWLKFTACEATVQLEFAVSNCLAASGLEFFILQTDDCQVFTAPQACFDIANGDTDTLTVGNLTIGETYYLMVDGIAGDICNWEVLSTFGVSEGAVYQEENTPGQVESVGDLASFCTGAMGSFYFKPADCGLSLVNGCPAYQQLCTPQLDTCFAVQYDTVWHVQPYGPVFENNDSIGSTVNIIFPDTLDIPLDSFLEFTVSVEFVPVAINTTTCWNDCLAECRTILSSNEPCAILPKVVKVCKPDVNVTTYQICPGECVDVNGQLYCDPGLFTTATQDECGCTDIHGVEIIWIFDSPAVAGPVTHTCSADGLSYTVSFDVFANTNAVSVNGQPLIGMNYISQPIPNGQAYTFLVESFGYCGILQPTLVAGAYTCPPCLGGTFDLGSLTLCPGDCFELLGNSYCNPGSYSELLYNPANNCNETYLFELTQTIESQLVTGIVSKFCDATNLYYQVGFPIESGTPPYQVNGNAINGNFYQSGLIPSGQPYAFTVTDAATCSPQQVDISGTYDCACINNPGSTQFVTLYGCEGEVVSVQFNNDALLGPSDLQVFILHDGSSNSLGNIVGMNTTGSFGFVQGAMTFGQTYRISPAVGPNQGGMVDMNASCFQFAPGQPVVFYEKPVTEILPHLPLNCTYNELTLYTMTLGGSGSFGFEWSSSDPTPSNDPNPIILIPGVYSVIVTDLLTGCTAQAATVVEGDFVLPDFTLTTGEINCQQPSATLEAASQMADINYTWTLPTGDHLTGAIITTNIPGDFTVTAQGPNGCTADGTTFVVDNGAPPSIETTDGVVACDQPTTTLTAASNDPAVIFTWTFPDGTTAVGPDITTSLPGIYNIVALAQNGCANDTIASVTQGADPMLTADLEVMPPTCFGFADGSIEISAGNGGAAPYEFTLEGIGVGSSFQNLPAGNYQLQITDANGCLGDSLLQLAEPEEVTVEIGQDQFINQGELVTLNMQASITPASIEWFGPNGQTWQGVTSLTINPMKTGMYSIVISDVSSCRSSDTTNIYINSEAQAFLPTAFSPNGDGNNDRITVFAGSDVKRIAHLQVFDRWGELVFDDKDFAPNDDLTLGWDGRHEGRTMDPALFVVMAEVEFLDGTKKLLKGEVALVK